MSEQIKYKRLPERFKYIIKGVPSGAKNEKTLGRSRTYNQARNLAVKLVDSGKYSSTHIERVERIKNFYV